MTEFYGIMPPLANPTLRGPVDDHALVALLDLQREQFVTFHEWKTLTGPQLYVYNYCEAIHHSLVSFVKLRLQMLELKPAEKIEYMNLAFTLENRCSDVIQSAYMYLHRIEVLTRPNGRETKLDILTGSSLSDDEKGEFLAEINFMSEFRNKVIEHVPQHLGSPSNFTQALVTNEPFEYRLHVFSPNVFEELEKSGPVSQALDQICQVVWVHQPPGASDALCRMRDAVDGARYLDEHMRKLMLDEVVKKIGCLSHTPATLAATMHTVYQITFPQFCTQ